MRLGVGLILIAVVSQSALAQKTYRWKDAEGQVHYGDQPPAEGAEEVRLLLGKGKRSPPAPDSASGDFQINLPDESAAVSEQAIEDECLRRQKQLDSYRKSVRIVETDGQGHQREYDAEEVAALIAKTEDQVMELCGEPVLRQGAEN